jgi:hypothetical protein
MEKIMSTQTRGILIASVLVAATLTAAGCAVSPTAGNDVADNSPAAAHSADGKWWAEERARDDGYGDVR